MKRRRTDRNLSSFYQRNCSHSDRAPVTCLACRMMVCLSFLFCFLFVENQELLAGQLRLSTQPHHVSRYFIFPIDMAGRKKNHIPYSVCVCVNSVELNMLLIV